MCLCYLFTAKTAWQLVNRKADFFYKTNLFEYIRITNRIESIRIANWNAIVPTISRAWNDLPPTIRVSLSLLTLRQQLQTILFKSTSLTYYDGFQWGSGH